MAELSQEAGAFTNRPDVARSGPLRLEEEVLPVGRPAPATLSCRVIPSGKQWVKISSVCGDFPECRAILGLHAEPQATSVGRPTNPVRVSARGNTDDLPPFRSFSLNPIQAVPLDIDDVFPVRKIGCCSWSGGKRGGGVSGPGPVEPTGGSPARSQRSLQREVRSGRAKCLQ